MTVPPITYQEMVDQASANIATIPLAVAVVAMIVLHIWTLGSLTRRLFRISTPGIGFHAVMFAFFKKIFAITEGLLPEDPKLTRAFNFITLEIGLLLGSILVPSVTLRLAIPVSTILVLSCEVVLASFFLSVLGLRRR